MSSIIKAVFKTTIGLLVVKGRDVAAERLKEGDVTDQKFRGLIVREIADIKSKLDGLSRNDLLAAVDVFEAGLRYLYTAIDEAGAATAEATERIKGENVKEFSLLSPPDAVETVALAAGMINMQLTELDETSKTLFSHANKRFEMARENATKASNNQSVSTFDRITAIRYRVMATMLGSAAEAVGSAGDLSSLSLKSALENALPECEQCLQKLHSLPAVQNSFKVEFQKGLNLRGRFNKDERVEIISTVCQVNRVIYDAMQTAGKDVHVLVWPFVDTGEDKVDPLRDGRVTKLLRKVGMEHYCVPWLFGQEGEKEHKLKRVKSIVTNTNGQFLVADDGNKTIKLFDSNGNFHRSFHPQTDDADTKLNIVDVAADVENYIYVLVEYAYHPWAKEYERGVRVFNNTADLRHTFPVKREDWVWGRLTVSGSKVLVLGRSGKKGVVDVYEQEGGFVRSLGEGVLNCASDIAATNDGCVMVLETGHSCVHLFTVEGQQLCKFNINIGADYYGNITCHPAGKHVVLAGVERKNRDRVRVAIFTKDGKFVRKIKLDKENIDRCGGIAVTMEGHIVVASYTVVIVV